MMHADATYTYIQFEGNGTTVQVQGPTKSQEGRRTALT